MNTIKQYIFRKAMHWYVDEDLDQWERFIVQGRKRTAYVRIDLEKPKYHDVKEPTNKEFWNVLRP